MTMKEEWSEEEARLEEEGLWEICAAAFGQSQPREAQPGDPERWEDYYPIVCMEWAARELTLLTEGDWDEEFIVAIAHYAFLGGWETPQTLPLSPGEIFSEDADPEYDEGTGERAEEKEDLDEWVAVQERVVWALGAPPTPEAVELWKKWGAPDPEEVWACAVTQMGLPMRTAEAVWNVPQLRLPGW